MSKTYLITGATSPLGLALMERLLPTLAEGDLILAQGCGDLARLASLCQARPASSAPYDADFTQPLAGCALSSATWWTPTPPPPTSSTCPACAPSRPLTPILDEERFADDRAVQLDSALLLCKTFLPRMVQAGSGRVLFLTGGVPAAPDGQHRHRQELSGGAGPLPGGGVRLQRCHRQLHRPRSPADRGHRRRPRCGSVRRRWCLPCCSC